jgi:RNA recognition motif-containing protein
VRLSRNKKTGKAKHYAFLEFQYPEVAAVAADAMNGYFMFKQKLEVKVRAEIKQRSSLEKRNMLHTALLATQNETSPLPSPLPSPL